MIVEYATDQPVGRQHPWSVVVANPTDRYVDFKAHPEQIPLALPDFIPWAHYPAIQTFYALLSWLNGPDSAFESNDCGLRPPRQDHNAPDVIRAGFAGDPVVMHARLTFIFRDLAWNASAPTVDGLKTSIHDGLRDNVPDAVAVVKVGDWAHFFTEIDRPGRAVILYGWAWGKDEAAAMAQLDFTFAAIHGCLRWISDSVRGERPAG